MGFGRVMDPPPVVRRGAAGGKGAKNRVAWIERRFTPIERRAAPIGNRFTRDQWNAALIRSGFAPFDWREALAERWWTPGVL